MVRARLVMALLAGVLGSGGFVAEASANVYWTNFKTPGSIGKANLDGSGGNLNFVNTGSVHPRSVAVDGQHIYWASIGNSTIGRANIDGSGANESFITVPATSASCSPCTINGVAVDRQHIYWTSGANTIGRANVDGSGVNPSFITGANNPQAIAVDSTHIYWTQAGATIGRANINGSGVNESFIISTGYSQGVAVDGAHIYWTNVGPPTAGGEKVYRANIDGSGAGAFITVGGSPYGVAVDSQHIYWTNVTTNTIGRANIDGTSANQSFISGATGPYSVSLDPTTSAVVPTKCVVPKLKGKTLKQAKKALKTAHCSLGKVNGPRTGHVKRQSPKPGKVLPAGSKVAVKLA